ncbi:unnamed protein product [Urochloa decumbens]|uniref:DUF1618 domain-containing protein n=1 Tax=Urochloa decumbens TaxID=240449 RepID=A0ABC8Y7Q6_9POAL
MPSSPPSSPSSWVILGSVARVSAAEDADLPPGGADLSLALAPPPRASLLIIPPRLFPDTPTARNFPAVLAADPSGLLLLHANQGRATGPLVIDRPGQRQFGWREFVDGTTATSSSTPPPDPRSPSRSPSSSRRRPSSASSRTPAAAAATSSPSSSPSSAVTTPSSSASPPTSASGSRRRSPTRSRAGGGSPPPSSRTTGGSGGLISPSASSPAIPSPTRPPWRSSRRVGAPQVSVWTLPDPDATEWALEHEASFHDLWADPSYKAAGLPEKIPVLALIHPKDPAVVYFFLQEHLFGVDLRARSVVECEVYELVAPERDFVATRFVHAWELPRALSSSSGAMDQTEEKLSPASPPSDLKNKE